MVKHLCSYTSPNLDWQYQIDFTFALTAWTQKGAQAHPSVVTGCQIVELSSCQIDKLFRISTHRAIVQTFWKANYYSKVRPPRKRPKTVWIGQNWVNGSKYVKFDFQQDGHLIFALWGPRMEKFRILRCHFNRGFLNDGKLTKFRETSCLACLECHSSLKYPVKRPP